MNVKMTGADFDLLQKAAQAHWPDAVLSNSGVVLGLAKIAAKSVLGKQQPKRPTRNS